MKESVRAPEHAAQRFRLPFHSCSARNHHTWCGAPVATSSSAVPGPGRGAEGPRVPRRTWGLRAIALSLVVGTAACAARDSDAPLRSPTYDYNREPIRLNSDGTVVGAESKDPGDRMDEVRNGGGWYVGPDGVPRYDLKRRIGGFVDKKFEAEAERSKNEREKK